MTHLLLVRHGQSTWNALGRWQGQADPPLTELGQTQARHAASFVGTVDIVVASDLERAHHTALIISETIGVGPVIIEPSLRERDSGEWSGMTRSEIEREWPGYLEAEKRPPSWETDSALLERVNAALDRINTEYHGANVLIVTHGGVIYALEAVHNEPWARIPNLGARQFTVKNDELILGERLVLVDSDEITIPKQI